MNKMNYIIEGTLSKVVIKQNESNKLNISFAIKGSEGYSIKQDNKKYNVFCPEKMPDKEKCVTSYIADSERLFSIGKEYENLLTQASAHGKRIQFTISENDLKNNKKTKAETSETSVTLLSD